MSERHRLGPWVPLATVAVVLAVTLPASAQTSVQTFVRDEAASAVLSDLHSGAALAWADYDGDGDPDLVLTGFGFESGDDYRLYGEVYRNDGGTLVRDDANSAVVADVHYGALAWADYDGDGDPDLVLTGVAENIFGPAFGEVYRNDGGTLVRDDANSAVVADTRSGALAWADYDGDGDPDLVLTGAVGNDAGGIFFGEVYRNVGGTLVLDDANSAVVPDVSDGELVWVDYDSDGDPDLVVAGYTFGAPIQTYGEVYRNDGGTLVRDAANSAAIPDDGVMAWADYDGDGDLDFAITYSEGGIRNPDTYLGEVYRNDGGTFVLDAANSAVVPNPYNSALAWGDYDGDGDPDLVLTGSQASYAFGEVYRNDGGTLVREDVASAAIPEMTIGTLAWADYDSDGDDDLALVGQGWGDYDVRNFGEVFRYEAVAPGEPPVADAGPDLQIRSNLFFRYVALNGSGSSDPDGDLLQYVWSEGGATVATGLRGAPRLTSGTHVLTLTVTDPSGLTDTDDVAVTVTPDFDLTLRPVPVQRPFIHVDPGESFLFNYHLDNRDYTRRGGDAWFVVVDAAGAEVFESDPVSFSLRIGRDRSWRLLVEVAASTAPGDYTVVGYIGDYPDRLYDVDSLAFRVRDRSGLASAAGRTGAAAWAVLDADTGLAPADWTDDGTDERTAEAEPSAFALGAPYPNPAAGLVTVPFAVAEPGAVRLAVYDVLGREVARLADGVAEAGAHAARLETRGLPAGAYVVRLEAGGAVATARLVVAR
ncbi:FG-GAP-like repeat-containing protein [Rubrivirga marina]|uniref:PKD/Chitinase domain-containing protein n=1 Tax=Rubrivirga marina TaxID=1196024 RepID=A0A271J533_9BACT|nr:FG-GAP-like repeat-containing protein [Rubrivirga marina]PAP78174.1 hypothetical protein BSZ37_17915 [Rubrivirga marina]